MLKVVSAALPRSAAPVICTMALVFVLAPSLMASTDTCEELGIFEVYDRLLPLVTPNVPAISSVVIRYIPGDPSIEREVLVAVRETMNGSIVASVRRPRATSIQQQLRDLKGVHPQVCDGVLLGLIEVDEFALPDGGLWRPYKSLLRASVPLEMSADIYLDAPRTEIVLETSMNRAAFVLYGPGVRERHPHPLLGRAKQVLDRALQLIPPGARR